MRIDTWSQTQEHEDNNRQSEATPLALPCGVRGVLSAADQDWFRFGILARLRIVSVAERAIH
ncbi:MAG TPA: hypothetical protein VFI31_28355 [Pirellulales bacterium]|nr:hypothetical protein [Pirellulales bacterium]